jgi:hypothetical protein
MHLRGFSPGDVKRVNKFADEVRGPAEKRNRAIHDPIFVNPTEGRAGRLEVTAQRRPVFEMVSVTPDELKAIRKEVWEVSSKFIEIRNLIFEALPKMPELPKSSSLPVDLRFVTPPRGQSECM